MNDKTKTPKGASLTTIHAVPVASFNYTLSELKKEADACAARSRKIIAEAERLFTSLREQAEAKRPNRPAPKGSGLLTEDDRPWHDPETNGAES